MAQRWGCLWRLVVAGAAVVAAVVLTRELSPTVQFALAGLGFSLAVLTGVVTLTFKALGVARAPRR